MGQRILIQLTRRRALNPGRGRNALGGRNVRHTDAVADAADAIRLHTFPD